eukprot:728872-Pelagomonas_calceolata.AAC.3
MKRQEFLDRIGDFSQSELHGGLVIRIGLHSCACLQGQLSRSRRVSMIKPNQTRNLLRLFEINVKQVWKQRLELSSKVLIAVRNTCTVTLHEMSMRS